MLKKGGNRTLLNLIQSIPYIIDIICTSKSHIHTHTQLPFNKTLQQQNVKEQITAYQ